MRVKLGLGLLTSLALFTSATAELPPESELPPAAKEATQGVSKPETNLPDESTLPPNAGALAALPPAGPLPLAGSPDGIPWLRLNLQGHTAPVRAVTFLPSGQRLCSAGDDKSVIVWLRDDQSGRWQYERTLRWQIQRGTRGRIYALAAAPGLIAVAGEGAMGGTGEIVLIHPATGDYVATLFDEANGHRQVVVALDFVETADGPALASQSMDGRTLLWMRNPTGVWKAQVVLPDDRSAKVSPVLAQRLLAGRAFSGVLALDQEKVIAAVPASPSTKRLAWRLAVIPTATPEATETRQLLSDRGPLHYDAVTAIAADSQRTKLVSADGAGAVYHWDLSSRPVQVRRLPRSQRTAALALSLSSDGKTLAVGTAASATGEGSVEVWDLANFSRPQQRATHPSPGNVLACTINGVTNELASSMDDDVLVRRAPQLSPQQRLRGATATPLRVAFPLDEPYYRIGISTTQDSQGKSAINQVFDTDRLRLTRTSGQADNRAPTNWLPATWGRGDWRVVGSVGDAGRRQWHFQQGSRRRARLPLAEERTGAFRSVCWIPGQDLKQPPLAALGTSAGDILLVRVAADGEAPIVRRLRGHSSEVTSIAVARDLRWLASASADATVRIWPLGAIAQQAETINRWGAEFAINEAGELMIAAIREDGPLYFRGARQGDRLVACEWIDQGEREEETDPQKLLATLTTTPWDRVVKFNLQTGRQPTRSFQILPAWQQIASLVTDEQGEWAYWAPSGYYDASFEGHRLFGWQINRGLDELPDFFLAAQFRAVLERPGVMSRLLRRGSLERAFRAAQTTSPADAAQAIANAYRLKPDVTITSPGPNATLGGGEGGNTLRATIRTRTGGSLATAKAFANGVVAPPGRLLSQTAQDGDTLYEYEWRLAVPSDPRVMVQVIASTEEEITGSAQRVWRNNAGPSQREPRLFLLAVGVDNYRDAQIPKLRTPVRSATELTELLRKRASELYQVNATSLLDDQATRPAWSLAAGRTSEQLGKAKGAEVGPNDLLIVYLSGHGVQDLAADKYHFITANADFSEVMAGGYADCLNLDDFASFAEISCRKLVILDTCHSGAIQPMRHREIKAAVRALQQDMLLTITASDGAEEAVEGQFSQRLIEGLSGAADGEAVGEIRDGEKHGAGDGVVQLDELIAYLRRRVSEDSLRKGFVQTPSAGPADLLPYVATPLTKAEGP